MNDEFSDFDRVQRQDQDRFNAEARKRRQLEDEQRRQQAVTQARLNVANEDRTPDAAAEANVLSRQTGVPPRAVDKMFADAYAAQLRAQDVENTAAQHPPYANFMADPDNAAAASDDTKSLSAISRNIGAAIDRKRALSSTTADRAWMSAPNDSSFTRLYKSAARGLAGARAGAGTFVSTLMESTVDPITAVVGVKPIAPQFKRFADRNRAVAETAIAGKQEFEKLPSIGELVRKPVRLGEVFQYMLDSTAESAAGTVMAITNPTIGFASNTGGIAQQRAAFDDRPDATFLDVVRAAPGGAMSTALDRFGFESIIGAEGKNAMIRIAKATAGEAATEFTQGVIENQYGSQGTKRGFRLDEALSQGVAGALAAPGMVLGVKIPHEVALKTLTVAQGYKDANQLGNIVSAAEASKLRARDPELFRQFVDQAAEGTGVENVYIPVEALETYQQSEGFEDLPPTVQALVDDQIEEAKARGGSVVVPVGIVTSELVGTKAWSALKDDVRITAGGQSLRETREQAAEVEKAVAEAGKTVATEPTDDGGQAEIYTRVKSELLGQGRSAKEADVIARIYADQAASQAPRIGMTAAEYVAFHKPVTIESVDGPAQAGQTATLDQPGNPAFDSWFGGSEVIDDAGAPMRVYHGTESNFDTFDPEQTGKTSDSGWFGKGLYFTPNPEQASRYATVVRTSPGYGDDAPKGSVVPVFLSVKNPFRTDRQSFSQSYVDQLRNEGYDGVFRYRYLEDAVPEEIVVFEPTQVKSAIANNGNFDPNDPSMLNQSAPALAGLPANAVGPTEVARQAAADYMAEAGLPYSPPTTYAKVDTRRAKRIAQAFDEMKHAPDDPLVRDAYNAMIEETLAQWLVIKKTGLVVEFIDGDDPYGNPTNAILDVRENNHLWVYPTSSGFGSSDADIAGNPLLATVEGETISGRPVQVNDIFRIVHDYFGHIKEGVGFRAGGEENAWRSHASMYSPLARLAMTTETRGQNSWVNYGPHGETNRTAGPADTIYADQKIGLLPQWVSEQGAKDYDATAMASWTPARIDDLLSRYADPVNPDQGMMHAARMSPDQFLGLTASKYGRTLLAQPQNTLGEIDVEKLAAAGPVTLIVSRTAARTSTYMEDGVMVKKAIPEEWRVMGHDGRHRMQALHEAGVTSVPVLLRLHEAGKPGAGLDEGVGYRAALTFNPQRGGRDQANSGFASTEVLGIEPVTHNNLAKLSEVMGAPQARVLFQSDEAVFYSALSRAVDAVKMAKAPAAQWKATLTNAPGVKAEELEWSGLLDLLDTADKLGETLTKQQLVDTLTRGGVRVEEVVLGAGSGFREDSQYDQWKAVTRAVRGANSRNDAVMRLENDRVAYSEVNSMMPPELENPDDPGELREDWAEYIVDDLYGEDSFGGTQFQEYSSDPSSSTYRELLLTLPKGEGTNPERSPSTHWDQPDVVAHIRFMEKQDVDGKRVLFIEEVQSDWHQKGRQQGYQTKVDPALVPVAQEKFDRLKAAYDAAFVEYEAAQLKAGDAYNRRAAAVTNGTATMEDLVAAQEEYEAAQPAVKAAGEKLEQARSVRDLAGRELDIAKGLITNGGIPDAPFRTSWAALAMKRTIRWAVDNGFDRVAWINGDQQNGGVTAQEEGVKAFYDRNLVNVTNALLKKSGGKVGPVALNDDKAQSRKIFLDNAALMDARAAEQEAAGESSARTRHVAAMSRADAEKIIPSQNHGFDITPALATAAAGGFPLFQNPTAPRGQIALGQDKIVISLFANSNMSTLIHETGHLFLERMQVDAAHPTATPELKADWAALKKWLKDQGHPIVKGVISRDAHELIARGFERYAMEGKAPSASLQGVFASMRAWLLRIYAVVDNLRSPITPELREVFDRMLATQSEIDDMRAAQISDTEVDTFMAKEMTTAEFKAYRALSESAKHEAYDQLLYKTMAKIRARQTARYRESEKAVKEEVTKAVYDEPRHVALHLLRTGKFLNDPERPAQSVKLDREWLEETFGAGATDRLPKGTIIWKDGGVAADDIAAMTGFGSGKEMVEALFALQEEKAARVASGDTRPVRDAQIDEQVKAEMDSRGESDIIEDGSIEEEAIAAVNNARQGEVIATQIRQLARRTKASPTPYAAAREWAKRKIMAGAVRDVASKSAQQRYARAAAKASRAAEAAILDGNIDEAFRQKQAQMLNHALLAEAKAAGDEVDVIVRRLDKLSRRAAMKSVDQDYMDQIHALLEDYDFRPKPALIAEREDFAVWAKEQQDKGFEVHVPQRLLAAGEPYNRMAVDELIGLNDTIASLLALGKASQTMLDGQAEREFAAIRQAVLDNLKDAPARKLPASPINEASRKGMTARRLSLRSAVASLLKIGTIAKDLDNGDPNGPMMNLLVHRATEAENTRARLREQVLLPLAKMYLDLSGKAFSRLQEKVTIPELTWNTVAESDPRAGTTVVLTRMELLAMALNTGNLSNLEKMSKGERWPASTIQAVLNRELSASDWALVQKMWYQVETLWPEIVKVERELSGVVPEKVVPLPITNSHGTFAGGYWPVVYDADRSQRAENNADKSADDMFGLMSGVGTPKGHTITRTNAVGPIRLSVEDVLLRHVEQVITRIAYAAYARDVIRTIEDPAIRGAIDIKMGSEYRRQIKPWLQRQISSYVDKRGTAWWEKFFRQARVNTTIVGMGFRLSTGVAQISGLWTSAGRIGAIPVAKGMGRAVAGIASAMAGKGNYQIEFIFERSEEMRRRINESTREVDDVFRKLQGRHTILDEAQAWAFWHIAMVDLHLVAAPTWLGAHQKAIDEGMTDYQASRYADQAVLTSQGGSRAKDLAAIQSPNSEAMKFFTMFYTPFNVLFNAQWETVRGLKRGEYNKAAQLTFFFLVAQMLSDALLSGDFPKPDEDDDWIKGGLQWFARNVFFGLFSGVPIVRDAATYTERTITGQYATFGGTPITRIGEETIRSSRNAAAVINGDKEVDPNMVPGAANTVGLFTGLPLGQPGTTAKFLWQYERGEVEPTTFADWYGGLVKGKMPEKETEEGAQ